jgi:hypothetical protein
LLESGSEYLFSSFPSGSSTNLTMVISRMEG